MTISATFRAGGLASGLDTSSIVDQLTAIEKQPMTKLQSRQSALKTQVSLLGGLASKLKSFETAASALKEGGTLALSASTTATAFTVTPTNGGTAGRFAVQVNELAAAGKARSQGFTDAFAPVTGGTLSVRAMGTDYDIQVADGATLQDVATSINQSGAPISAALVSDGTQTFLSLTNRDTGFPIGGTAADGLSVSFNTTGGLGQALNLAVTQPPKNAELLVDGLAITRTSNVIADAVPGVSITLKGKTTTPDDLVLNYDGAATAKKLQTMVDAYNDVLMAVQTQLNVAAGSDRSKTLAGDSVVRGLQQAMQRTLVTQVNGTGDVRTLADLGLKTNRDGSLTIDQPTLEKAVARSPSSIDALFSTQTTGFADVVKDLVTRYTSSSGGLISSRKSGLETSIKDMDTQLERMQARVDAFQQNLIRQFTAMETAISSTKSMGNFITQAFATKSES